MKILTNKFFIFGNLLLLLIAIPVTLYFVKKQEEVRSKAAASSTLTLTPNPKNSSTTCPSFTMDVMVDPGTNLVSFVDFYITWDPTKLDVSQITPSDTFKTVQRAASISSGQANISLDAVGGDVTKAVSTPSKVATITFIPKAAGTSQVSFDSQKTQILSLSSSDQPYENVLSNAPPATVNLNSNACTDTTSVSITPGVGASVTPAVNTVTATPIVNATVTPSASVAATVAPTAVPTAIPTAIPTAVPTVAQAQPTVPATGSFTQTIGIITGVVLTVGVGFILLAL